MTGIQIAKKWIELRGDRPFTYLQFQQEIMGFAKRYTEKFYRYDSWDRYFRMVKSYYPDLLEEVKEIKDENGAVIKPENKTWQPKFPTNLFSEAVN
jgi:hypothetical protein